MAEHKACFAKQLSSLKSTRTGAVDPATDYNIGNSYAGLKKHKEAIKYFDKSIAEKPNTQLAAQIFTNRGNELDDIGKHDDAIQSFKNAIKHNPKLWNAHASWASLEVRQNNYKEAIEHFREAFLCNPELNHSNYDVRYWFAYSLYQVGELEEALSIVDDILLNNPLNKHELELKAYLLAKLRVADKSYIAEAVSFFTKRLADDPSNMLVRSELNQIYLDQGLDDKRHKLIEETASFENAPAMALYDYAVILESEGKIDKAIASLEKAAKKDQNHLIVHKLAHLKRSLGKYREAITFYKLALKEGKESLPILRDIANCYHFLAEYEKSVKVLSVALLIDSRQIQIWNNLGFALNQLKAYEMSLICAMTIKELQQNNEIDTKATKEAIDNLLSQMKARYGEDFVAMIKEAKQQRNYSEL